MSRNLTARLYPHLRSTRWLSTTHTTATPPDDASSRPSSHNGKVSARTPLLAEIEKRIAVRGPMSIAEFMTLALTHPVHGYYATKGYKAFGQEGDFVTSPEISQLFGEMVGIWAISSWERLGRPSAFHLVELGGGRGTLMRDALRTFSAFPEFARAIKKIHMVENSSKMQRAQQETLLNKSPSRTTTTPPQPGWWPPATSFAWVDSFAEVKSNSGEPIIIIAQELFDALPVHQFEKVAGRGWCERVVDVEDHRTPTLDLEGTTHHLRFALSPGATPAASLLMGGGRAPSAPPGARVELGAAGLALAQDIAARVSASGGCALMVDYGRGETDPPLTDSLRGILAHRFVHPLREPGRVDLSVDVDFPALREAARLPGGARLKLSPIVTQREFLSDLGIAHRLRSLLAANAHDEELQLKLYQGYKRLVEDMGHSYKTMAMYAPSTGKLGSPPPEQQLPPMAGFSRFSGVSSTP